MSDQGPPDIPPHHEYHEQVDEEPYPTEDDLVAVHLEAESWRGEAEKCRAEAEEGRAELFETEREVLGWRRLYYKSTIVAVWVLVTAVVAYLGWSLV